MLGIEVLVSSLRSIEESRIFRRTCVYYQNCWKAESPKPRGKKQEITEEYQGPDTVVPSSPFKCIAWDVHHVCHGVHRPWGYHHGGANDILEQAIDLTFSTKIWSKKHNRFNESFSLIGFVLNSFCNLYNKVQPRAMYQNLELCRYAT